MGFEKKWDLGEDTIVGILRKTLGQGGFEREWRWRGWVGLGWERPRFFLVRVNNSQMVWTVLRLSAQFQEVKTTQKETKHVIDQYHSCRSKIRVSLSSLLAWLIRIHHDHNAFNVAVFIHCLPMIPPSVTSEIPQDHCSRKLCHIRIIPRRWHLLYIRHLLMMLVLLRW